MKHSKIAAIFIVFSIMAGCAAGRPVVVDTSIKNHTINSARKQVFDAALVVAQMQNLNVAVLEKQSGLIRFETASLSATQLDKYCEYPYTHPSTGKPWDTFQNWNERSLKAGFGPVSGKVSISILITEKDASSNINMRSNWNSYNSTESTPCNSRNGFESEFMTQLKSQVQ